MSLDPIELADAQRVELGGKTWLLPSLVWKQIKVVIPGIDAFRARYAEIMASGSEYGEADLDQMLRIVWAALTRARPDLTLAELEELPISVSQLAVAIPLVAKAAGLGGKAPLPTTTATKEAEAEPSHSTLTS
jgi:hypothetical protein